MAQPAREPRQLPAVSQDEQETTRALAAAYDYIRALVARWDAARAAASGGEDESA